MTRTRKDSVLAAPGFTRRLPAAAGSWGARLSGLLLRLEYALSALRLPGVGTDKRRILKAIADSGYFDPAFYLEQNPHVRVMRVAPLVHYVVRGAGQGLDPNPLFDTAYYLEQNPDVARSGLNPLEHYLRHGAREGRKTRPPAAPDTDRAFVVEELASHIETIRPFFDVSFYLRQCPELAERGGDPYEHYLRCGARQGKDPHPLFDTSFYLDHNPDVARGTLNPLVHFALFGGKERRDPHPLFHTAYYLRTNPGLDGPGSNPLLHYLLVGGVEGRDPNPMFDSAHYQRSNPQVRGSMANPLVHFIEHGAAEGRNPHPAFDVRLYVEHHPHLAASGINPLADYFDGTRPRAAPGAEPGRAPATRRPAGRFRVEAVNPRARTESIRRRRRTILCVSHISPYPPRAGNEYGAYRQLHYLERRGYRVVLALSPLPGDELTVERFRTLCERFPDSILCGRDGLVQHQLDDDTLGLETLEGRELEPLGTEIGEDRVTEPRDRTLVEHERVFCHDFLARLALHLEAALTPCIVLSQYVFQTRFLPLIRSDSIKVIQTHDMFSTTQRKVVPFGVQDTLNLTAEQERKLLLRADLILSCQHAEAQEFAALVPERQVLEIPLDFDVVEQMPAPRGARVLYVASDNTLNTKGLRDFLRLAWPRILKDVPDVVLLVAGKVCHTVERAPENVHLLGLVDNLEPLYEQATLTINPSVAGTGLKIKTAESLSRLRPVVGWPSGVDGFQPEIAAMCYTARDWPDFAAQVIRILRSPGESSFSAEQQERIRHWFAPDTIYAPLTKRLDEYCVRHDLQPYESLATANRGER